MTSVRLNPEAERRLKAAARRAGVSKSELIRKAIDEKVAEVLSSPQSSPSKFTGRLAGLEHLIGSVQVDEPISTRRIGDQYAALLDERWRQREAAKASEPEEA